MYINNGRVQIPSCAPLSNITIIGNSSIDKLGYCYNDFEISYISNTNETKRGFLRNQNIIVPHSSKSKCSQITNTDMLLGSSISLKRSNIYPYKVQLFNVSSTFSKLELKSKLLDRLFYHHSFFHQNKDYSEINPNSDSDLFQWVESNVKKEFDSDINQDDESEGPSTPKDNSAMLDYIDTTITHIKNNFMKYVILFIAFTIIVVLAIMFLPKIIELFCELIVKIFSTLLELLVTTITNLNIAIRNGFVGMGGKFKKQNNNNNKNKNNEENIRFNDVSFQHLNGSNANENMECV